MRLEADRSLHVINMKLLKKKRKNLYTEKEGHTERRIRMENIMRTKSIKIFQKWVNLLEVMELLMMILIKNIQN
jgi:hypothetical protein